MVYRLVLVSYYKDNYPVPYPETFYTLSGIIQLNF